MRSFLLYVGCVILGVMLGHHIMRPATHRHSVPLPTADEVLSAVVRKGDLWAVNRTITLETVKWMYTTIDHAEAVVSWEDGLESGVVHVDLRPYQRSNGTLWVAEEIRDLTRQRKGVTPRAN